MADLRDDLTAIVDEVRRVVTLPGAETLRRRSDRRRRRRAAVGAAGLAVVAIAAGATLVQARSAVETPGVGPASQVAPPVVPSATASAGPQDILAGRRQVQIVLPGMSGATLAIDRDGDQVRATTEQGIDDRALWVLRPEGDRYRILLASGANAVCMTVVHDTAPGSVRGRACDAAASTQLFRIDQVPDGSYSIFQGKRYVQVVDGTNALVPDLPEGLTTTYEFLDRGPR
ncbi:RICIN domain-containing protein [Micromonospora sp. CPCC 205558]|uniref:RICIN domain-containing protein n=1 Tax=Micromonospora sp. CPCC 205558 TaxID=3122403 RepID=UPI002FF1D5DD